jgi:hypothetical protein
MNHFTRSCGLLICCVILLAACDSATASPTPAETAPTIEATAEAVSTGDASVPTSTPAPPITPVTKAVEGKFLFVEIWYEASGNGDLPRLIIDFPTYAFNPVLGTLSSTQFSRGRPIVLRSGDWGLLGTGSRRSGSAGGGTGSGLERLPALPFNTNITLATGAATDSGETTRKAVVRLQGATSDGKVEAVIDGERVVLAPGARWERKFAADLTTASHKGRYDLTSTVTNYGWIDQAKIQNVP